MEFKLIILAIIQGVTEFLPISSSGHLNFLSYFMHLESMLFYFLVLHVGTAFAALWYFRKDIWDILRGLWDFIRRKATQDSKDSVRWVVLILIVSAPTAVAGIILRDHIESNSLLSLGAAWLATAGFLFLTKNHSGGKKDLHDFTYLNAFIVGLAQSFALIPGISRSGATIAAGLLLGATPFFAGRLSFLASFVAIFGAMLLEVISYIRQDIAMIPASQIITGLLVSFTVGLLSLRFLINLLSKGRLYLFSYYCFAMGAISIALYFINL